MPENNQFKETIKEVDPSPQEKATTPLTKMLDEFLKDRPSGTVANASDVLKKTKEDHEKLNDQMNPKYKRYDGRDALSQIENPPEIKVQTTLNEKGQPISFSNVHRDVNIEYSPDGKIEKVSVTAKEKSASPYWSEADLVSFEKKKDGGMQAMMQLQDGQLYPSRSVSRFSVEPNGSISYFDDFYRNMVHIGMDNSVTTYGRSNVDGVLNLDEYQTFRRDGSTQMVKHSRDGAKLIIEGEPATIFQNESNVYGVSGIAPKAALLESKDGGRIAFLPNKDGTYTRAAFDPQGNMSADVMFHKPLAHFLDELKSVDRLGIKWSSFDKSGVRFTMTGTSYSVMENIDHYLDLKRHKGR